MGIIEVKTTNPDMGRTFKSGEYTIQVRDSYVNIFKNGNMVGNARGSNMLDSLTMGTVKEYLDFATNQLNNYKKHPRRLSDRGSFTAKQYIKK